MTSASRGFLLVLLVAGGAARAEEFILPPTLLLPNYDRGHPGMEEALEAGAFIARARDVSAVLYNPAGIALVQRSVLNASVQGFQVTTLGGTGFQHSTPVSSFEGLPSSIGVVLGTDALHWDTVHLGIALMHPIHWTQSAVATTYPAPVRRVSYSVTSEFDMLVPTVSIGWAATRALRLGGSIELPYTTLDEAAQLSGELRDSTSGPGTLRNITAGGSTFQIRAVLAVQWEPLSWLAVGTTVRTPGLDLVKSGTFRYESMTSIPGGTRQAFFWDTDAKFEYRLPAEIGLAMAVSFWRFAFEFDLRWHDGTHTYALFRSERPALVVEDTSGAPVTSTVPFPGIDYRAQQVWNWSFGLQLVVSPLVSLSGGMYADHSPVGLDSSVFRRIDMIGFRGGVSFRGRKLSGSVGFGWEHGKGNDSLVSVDLPVAGEKAEITLDTFSVIASVSFRF